MSDAVCPGRSLRSLLSISAQMRTCPFTGSISGSRRPVRPHAVRGASIRTGQSSDLATDEVLGISFADRNASARSRSRRISRITGVPGSTTRPRCFFDCTTMPGKGAVSCRRSSASEARSTSSCLTCNDN